MKYFLLLATLSLLFACTEVKVEQIVTEVPVLRASDIYNSDSVYAYMNKYKEEHKQIADSYFEKGKKEELNPEKAVYFFKRAITLHPTLEGYKALAKALEKVGKYEEMNRLYYIIANTQNVNPETKSSIYLFEQPNEELMYEEIIGHFLAYGKIYADDIYSHEDNGFDRSKLKSKLLADKRIKLDTTTAFYKNLMLQFEPYDQLELYSKKPAVFKDFLATIPDSSANFEIDEHSVQEFHYEDFNGINYNDGPELSFSNVYVHYLKEATDNSRRHDYNFNHIIRIGPAIVAVVYAIDTSSMACPKDMRHIYHQLVTYDNNTTNIIDSKIVALQSGTQLETARFKNKRVTVSTFERIWKKPYDKDDYDNDLLKMERKGERIYEIMPDGMIKETTSLASAGQ